MTKPKVIAVIPARYHSMRFEGKPLADILGKPMIYHVYHQVARADLVDGVIVATDDERIRRVVLDFRGQVEMTSSKNRTGTDRMAEVAKKVPANIFVNVQCDEPLIQPEAVNAVIRPLLEEADIQVTNLIAPITDPADFSNPNVVKAVKDPDDYLIYLSRAPVPHAKTPKDYQAYKQTGVYAFRREFLLKYASWPQTALETIEEIEILRIIENRLDVKGVLTQYESIGVNTPADLERVRQLLTKQGKKMRNGELL